MLPFLMMHKFSKCKFIPNFYLKIWNKNIKLAFSVNGFLPFCFLFSLDLIIVDEFNSRSSSANCSRSTNIKVCDDIATHLKKDFPNFRTDIGFQSLNGLWVVVVHSLL